MTEINFGSTYRIPITQQGINNSKKIQLKSLISSFNGLVGTGNTGYARVSIPNSKDESFIRKLKHIGYRVYQIFEGENIARNKIDDYIKECMNGGDYKQFGKQKAKTKDVSRRAPKEEEYVWKNLEADNVEKQNRIRNTEGYKQTVAEYGKEFAEALYFYTRVKK